MLKWTVQTQLSLIQSKIFHNKVKLVQVVCRQASRLSLNDLLLRSILLTVQKSIEENNQLLRTFKPLPSHDRSESQDFVNLASNEAHSPATQVAPTPASQEANTSASQEALDSTNMASDAPCRNAEEDALSVLGEMTLMKRMKNS